MTLILKLDQDMVKMYLLLKMTHTHTHTHTHTDGQVEPTEIIFLPICILGKYA